MILAENQIKAAFATAEHEVKFLHKRTSEGVRQAQARYKKETIEGIPHKKQKVGRAAGSKVETKKARECKQLIQKHSKSFEGTLNDIECMKLTGLDRNTYYKYKKELVNEPDQTLL